MSDRRERVALAIGHARFPKYEGSASDYDLKLADAALAAMQDAEPTEPTEAEIDAAWAMITDWPVLRSDMRAALIAARNAEGNVDVS